MQSIDRVRKDLRLGGQHDLASARSDQATLTRGFDAPG
jgi:hypothetical protein